MLDSLRGFALWGVLVVNTTIIARPPDGSLGDYEAVLLGASILYLAQLAMSALWLRVFRFRPAEWAWRSLTYGSFQPLRQSSLPAYSPMR